MVLYQFVWTTENQTQAPLVAEITHHFSGRRVRVRFIHWCLKQNATVAVYPKIPIRIDFSRGITSNIGTAVAPYNPDSIITNSTSMGLYVPNAPSDQALHGWQTEGFCVGNTWEAQLNLATAAPGEVSSVADIKDKIDHAILTIDVELIS